MHTHWILYRHKREGEWWQDLGTWDLCTCRRAPHYVWSADARVARSVRPLPPDPARWLEALPSARALLLWGYCGALTAPLEPGHLVIATQVLDPRRVGDGGWYLPIPPVRRYQRPPDVYQAPLLTWPQAVLRRRDRERLHRQTGAWAVDMEAARVLDLVADRIPLTVVKMVLDGPREDLRQPLAFARQRHRELRRRVRPPLDAVLTAWLRIR